MVTHRYITTIKKTSAVRLRISSKLISASCVGYFDRYILVYRAFHYEVEIKLKRARVLLDSDLRVCLFSYKKRLWYSSNKPSTVSRLSCNNVSGDFTNHHGGFGVSGHTYYQLWSESRLTGPVWWEKLCSEILSSIKSDQMGFFAGLFQPLLKAIENAFARDLGGIIQLCMGYSLGGCGPWRITTIRAWLLWYTAGTQHPCIDHHGEGEHQF